MLELKDNEKIELRIKSFELTMAYINNNAYNLEDMLKLSEVTYNYLANNNAIEN